MSTRIRRVFVNLGVALHCTSGSSTDQTAKLFSPMRPGSSIRAVSTVPYAPFTQGLAKGSSSRRQALSEVTFPAFRKLRLSCVDSTPEP